MEDITELDATPKQAAVLKLEGLRSIGVAATGVLMMLFGMAVMPSIATILQDDSTVEQHAGPSTDTADHDTDGNPKWH